MPKTLLSILGALVVAIGCSQSDVGITTNVKSKLVADDLVKARNIDVDTKNHLVTLTGIVQSAAEEERAMDIARRTPGVSDVVDRMDLKSPMAEPGALATSGSMITDAAITADLKTRLLAQPDVSGLAIDVDTRDGVVTLSGRVRDANERTRAEDTARKIDGVKRVDNELTISPTTQK